MIDEMSFQCLHGSFANTMSIYQGGLTLIFASLIFMNMFVSFGKKGEGSMIFLISAKNIPKKYSINLFTTFLKVRHGGRFFPL